MGQNTRSQATQATTEKPKSASKGRVFYAYVSDEAPLTVKKLKAARSKDFKFAIVSGKPVSASKVGRVFRKTKLHLLAQPDFKTPEKRRVKSEAYEPDAKARALLRGVKIVEEELKSSGGAYSLEQTQELMHGITRQAINNRVRDGSLLAVPGPSNRAKYPVIQFMPDGSPVEGLKVVRRALHTSNGWMLLNFLVNPDSRLGGKRPIDVLKAGDVEKVVEVAQRVGVQGA